MQLDLDTAAADEDGAAPRPRACPPDRAALRARLAALRDALGEGLIERDVPVRLALLAALAGEHLLLIGPPGTAKSELARRLRGAFVDATYFERLLTRFSVPEELFGPLSLKALERDEYRRLTEGYLPAATASTSRAARCTSTSRDTRPPSATCAGGSARAPARRCSSGPTTRRTTSRARAFSA